MKLHQLAPVEGATKKAKRIGRGQGSRRGGTSTKGHKGAQARTGYNTKFGFEGGQMPVQRRMPKFGFKNPFRVEYVAVNIDQLQTLAEEKGIKTFTPETFLESGMISSLKYRVKVLGRGEIRTSIVVTANRFSASAKAAIEAAGGSAHEIPDKVLVVPHTKWSAEG
jgi:large subunit ribosomal protein L15